MSILPPLGSGPIVNVRSDGTTDGRPSLWFYQFLQQFFGGAQDFTVDIAALQARAASDETWIALSEPVDLATPPQPLLSELLADDILVYPKDLDRTLLRALAFSLEADPIPRARANIFGIVRPDGTTVTVNDGVLSAVGSGGSVTSVGLSMPAEFTVAGSPITTNGTLAVTKANQNANVVYAGPATGAAAQPAFRALVIADMPAGVAPKASPTFSGTVTMPDNATWTNTGISGLLGLGITQNQNAATTATVFNNSALAAAQSAYVLNNGSITGGLSLGGSGFTTNGLFKASQVTLYANSGALAIGSLTNQPLVLGVNNTEFARIDAGTGNALFGYTVSNGAFKLQVNSQIFATSATIATSDEQFKTNITDLSSALSIIMALRPIEFDFLPDETHDFPGGRQIGFSAQQVQQTLAGSDYGNAIVFENETGAQPAVEAQDAMPAVVDQDGVIMIPAMPPVAARAAIPASKFLGLADLGPGTALIVRAMQEMEAEIAALRNQVASLQQGAGTQAS